MHDRDFNVGVTFDQCLKMLPNQTVTNIFVGSRILKSVNLIESLQREAQSFKRWAGMSSPYTPFNFIPIHDPVVLFLILSSCNPFLTEYSNITSLK